MPAFLIPVAIFVFGTILGCGGDEDTPLSASPDQPLPLPPVRYNPDVSTSTDANANGSDLSKTSEDICIKPACAGALLTNPQDGKNYCVKFDEVKFESSGYQTTDKRTGFSVVDLNKDQKPDFYVLNANRSHQLFQMKSDSSLLPHFEDKSTAYQLDIAGKHTRTVWNDADGSGKPDCLLLGHPTILLKNNQNQYVVEGQPDKSLLTNLSLDGLFMGSNILLATENGTKYLKKLPDGTYVDDTPNSGLSDTGYPSRVIAADYDGDGIQDIFLANQTGANALFRQAKDGHFTRVHEEVIGKSVQSMDAQWVVPKNGGTPSLIVLNWDNYNQFLSFDSAGGIKDTAAELGVAAPGPNIFVRSFQLFKNQDPSLFIGRWQFENLLYVPDENTKPLTYVDEASQMSVGAPASLVGVEMVDVNGDGFTDIVELMEDGVLKIFQSSATEVKGCGE